MICKRWLQCLQSMVPASGGQRAESRRTALLQVGGEHTAVGCWEYTLDSRAGSHRWKGASPRQLLVGLSPSDSWRSWLGASLPNSPPATLSAVKGDCACSVYTLPHPIIQIRHLIRSPNVPAHPRCPRVITDGWRHSFALTSIPGGKADWQ